MYVCLYLAALKRACVCVWSLPFLILSTFQLHLTLPFGRSSRPVRDGIPTWGAAVAFQFRVEHGDTKKGRHDLKSEARVISPQPPCKASCRWQGKQNAEETGIPVSGKP